MNKFGPEIQETVAKNMPENLMGEIAVEKDSNVENISMMKIFNDLVEGVVASFANFAKSLFALFSGTSSQEVKKENSTSSLSLGHATYVALFSVVSFYGLSWLVSRNSFFASQVQTSIEVNSSKLLK
jgi:hypothetical protein